MMRWTVMLSMAVCGACNAPHTGDRATLPEVAQAHGFVSKAWVSTDVSAAPGTLRIFLPDGSLLMGSCVETYRLARWRSIDDRHIEWTEETARIQSEIVGLTDEQLQLRLQLVGEVKDETYRVAKAPSVCPDMPR